MKRARSNTIGWTPILGQEDAARAHEAVDSIAAALRNSDVACLYGPSLARGSAGVAVFLSYLAEVNSSRWSSDLASASLQHALAAAEKADRDLGLFTGHTGIAWTAQYLARTSPDTPLGLRLTVDASLESLTGTGQCGAAYDLVSGLVGFGVYALDGLARKSGPTLLSRVIDQLAAMATWTREGAATWWTPADYISDPDRKAHAHVHLDVGLAHGIPGVIGLLGRACASSTTPARVHDLLARAVSGLLAQRLPDGAVSRFPSVVLRDAPQTNPRGSRLAWCYGDLGLSAALYSAGAYANYPEWKEEALSIARHAAGRRLKMSGVKDAGLCHGAAGIGHILNRLYQATREEIFLEAARFWFQQVLSMYRLGTGIGGFGAWVEAGQPIDGQWWHMPGFLEGSAGIGLALLAATSSLEPTWDRVMLLSMPIAPLY